MGDKIQKLNTETGKRSVGHVEESDLNENITKPSTLSQRQNKRNLKKPCTAYYHPFLQNVFYLDSIKSSFKTQFENGAQTQIPIIFENDVLKGSVVDNVGGPNQTKFICQYPGIYWIYASLNLEIGQTSDIIKLSKLYLEKNGNILLQIDSYNHYNYIQSHDYTLQSGMHIKLEAGDEISLKYVMNVFAVGGLTLNKYTGRLEGHWLGNNCRTKEINEHETA